MIDIFGDLGGAHIQVARTYPLKDRTDPAAWSVLEAVKREVDPTGAMNPGALGL